MVTKLVQHGNDYFLPVDRKAMESLGIGTDTPLNLSTDEQGLHITRASPNRHERRPTFQEALDDTNRKYGAMLKRLA